MSGFWRRRRVVVAGGSGFIGGAVCHTLAERGCTQVLIPRRTDYDLTTARGAADMYETLRPDLVIALAGVGGGIVAHREHSALHFYENLAMAMNLVEQGRRHGVDKIVYLSSADAYPHDAQSPLREEDLWTGLPHEVHRSYGLAKRTVHVMLESYLQEYGLRSAYLISTNVFGPGASFDPTTAHVVPAMIRRFGEAVERGAETVACWGSGNPTRDFLFVDDAAEGIVLAAEKLSEPDPVNLGSGREVPIRELAETIARLVNFHGSITWDLSKPDGQPRRCLETSRARRLLGFSASTDLETGLGRTIAWWRTNRLRPELPPVPPGRYC